MNIKKTEVEGSCSICSELLSSSTVKGGGNLLRVPCSHAFHRHCLLEWLKTNFPGDLCPLCKEKTQEPRFPVVVSAPLAGRGGEGGNGGGGMSPELDREFKKTQMAFNLLQDRYSVMKKLKPDVKLVGRLWGYQDLNDYQEVQLRWVADAKQGIKMLDELLKKLTKRSEK